MKKIFALLITLSMLLGLLPVVSFAETTPVTLDSLLGNELTNGTFEAGVTGWTVASGDATIASELATTNNNSAKAMKITGAGTVSTTAMLYPQETYTVSVWAKPVGVSANVTVTIDGKTAINTTVTAAQTLTGVVKLAGNEKKGGALTLAEKKVSVVVDAACYIDDVIVKESKEKIVDQTVSTDGWNEITTGSAQYIDAENGVEITSNKSAAAVQYVALKKGATYKIDGQVYLKSIGANAKPFNLYWGEEKKIRQTTAEKDLNEWNDLSAYGYTNIDNADPIYYPVTSESGEVEKIGVFVTLGGAGNTYGETIFRLKDFSITEVVEETTIAAPEINNFTLTAGDTEVTNSITSTVASGNVYYMYRYYQDDEVVLTGFGDTIPAYPVSDDFVGEVSLLVTPVNQQGIAGAYQEKKVTYVPEVLPNAGIADFDAAIGNKIAKGTFENGMPDWTLNGITMTAETENIATNSFKSAKLTKTGDGEAEISATLYENELYDVALSVKPVSEAVNVTLTADFGNGITQEIFAEEVSAGNWTKLENKLLRYSGTYKNKEAKTAAVTFTLTISGDCYLDEFTVTPAENMLLAEDGKRVYGSGDGVNEVSGWLKKGNITLTESNGTLQGLNMYGADNSASQYVVYEKGATYRLTANVKLADGSSNNKGKVYSMYNTSPQNVTLTSDWQALTYDIDASNIAYERLASVVIFSGQNSGALADMDIKDASLVKVKKFTAPSTTVDVASTAVQGDNVSAVATSIFKNGDSVGYKYCYEMDGKTIGAGYATGDNIPAITAPEPAGATGVLKVTVIPVNSEGTFGASASAECTVSSNYVVNVTPVSASALVAGQNVVVTTNVINNTDELGKFVVIAAYYENDVMMGCDFLQKTISANDDEDYTLSVALPPEAVGGGSLRVYVWKGYEEDPFPMESVTNVINPVNN